MNDRIFFVSPRGNFSAVMQMFISNSSTRSSRAVDISAHVQQYIHGNVDRLTGSPVSNMLFIGSHDNRQLVFVYKYYEKNANLVQSAWFKWEFNGKIFNSFALGSRFHLMIDRNQASAEEDWIMGSGMWNMNKKWDMDYRWIMEPDDLISISQFETMEIVPQNQRLEFLDNGNTKIHSLIDFGEWVQGPDGNKEIRGRLLFKTVQFSAEEGSAFDMWVRDIRRKKTRTVAYRNIKGRTPMVYGDARYVRVGISANDEKGFRITAVSYEGEINRRAKVK
jgi:hypothetical protein